MRLNIKPSILKSGVKEKKWNIVFMVKAIGGGEKEGVMEAYLATVR